MAEKVSKEVQEHALSVLEKVRKNGKIKIGTNEVTKAIERGVAKLVYIAEDVSPKEVVMHLPILCAEKNIAFTWIPTKKELGEKAGIDVGASSVVITDEGEAKKEVEDVAKKLKDSMK
ncbi:MAG: 50S ribosomal protein L7Ae [Candidatus Diapherotrites archaeon]